MSATPASLADVPPVKTDAQPKALTTLFFAEMWERFSYYGMRALLVLYLVNAAGYTRSDALILYGTYTGLVYLSPVLGGYVSDRYLGYRKAILAGGLIMMLGHFAMAIPALLHLALGLLVVGNGLFKPNITTFLGTFYGAQDPRRDGGFTIFYMGINLGAFLAPLVAGTLGEKVGWHWGFASAGVGMGFGLLQFWLGRSRLGTGGFPPGQSTLTARDGLHVLAMALAAVGGLLALFQLWPLIAPVWAMVPLLLRVAVPLALVFLLLRDVRRQDGHDAMQQVLAILVLAVFVIAFWTGFEQAGGTMSLFADKQTDRHVFGWLMPASYFQTINPLTILLLAPLFSLFWTRLDRSRWALSTPAKMATGMIILGLGFALLYVAQQRASAIGPVAPFWLAGVYVLHTIGELCLSPIGLSMVTKLAPVRVGALLMGVWFIANGVAGYLSGILESLLATSGLPLFGVLVVSSIGAGLLLLLLTPVLRGWMHGRG